MPLLTLAAGCGAEGPLPPQGASRAGDGAPLSASFETTRRCGPGVDLTVADPPVMDPSLDDASVAVSVRVRGLGTLPTSVLDAVQPLRVSLHRGETEVAVLSDVPDALPGATVRSVWNGQLNGAPAPRGEYTVRVRYGCETAATVAARVHVVRIGVTSVDVGDGDGQRIPLLWHKLGGIANNYWLPPNDRPILVRASGQGVAALNADDGSVTAIPALSTDLTSPPMGPNSGMFSDARDTDYNLPFALRVGTRPDVTLHVALDDAGAQPPRIRVQLEGAQTDTGLLADGAVTFRYDASPAPNVGRYELPLRVRFEAERADHTWAVFGRETLPTRVYGLLGDQTINDSHEEPYAPWLSVVDAVTGWVDGSTSDPHAVAGIVVHHVNEAMGLRYDTRAGQSFYTEYRPNSYSGARFDLTGFIDRAHGSTVNCSDCASIVSTYANMVGCDLGYAILTQDFPLHYIRAIGTTAFTNDPFRRGMAGGFHYHAVTTPSADGTDIFDATLTEDGDDHPEASPFVDLVPDGLARAQYLSHLSPRRLTITHDDKTAIE